MPWNCEFRSLCLAPKGTGVYILSNYETKGESAPVKIISRMSSEQLREGLVGRGVSGPCSQGPLWAPGSNTGEETSLFTSPPAHTISRLCTVLPHVSAFRKGIYLQINFLEVNYFAHIGPCFGRTKSKEQCFTTTKKKKKKKNQGRHELEQRRWPLWAPPFSIPQWWKWLKYICYIIGRGWEPCICLFSNS